MNSSPDNAAILRASGLTKFFDGFCAVDHIHFAMPQGICFGFLGPNGAGKTTTLKMIYGALIPTEGDIQAFGRDIRLHRKAVKRRLGVVQQKDILELSLSAWDNLDIHGRHFGMGKKEICAEGEHLLTLMELSDRALEPVFHFSGGMKRRLSIVKALLNKPDLLLLDEPTTGLDPQSRHKMWDFIGDLKKQGVTIFLTTHYMEEAQMLCEDLVILDRGRIIEKGSPGALIQKHQSKNLEEVFLHLTGRELRDE